MDTLLVSINVIHLVIVLFFIDFISAVLSVSSDCYIYTHPECNKKKIRNTKVPSLQNSMHKQEGYAMIKSLP